MRQCIHHGWRMSHSEETRDGHDSDNEDRRYPVGNDFDFHIFSQLLRQSASDGPGFRLRQS